MKQCWKITNQQSGLRLVAFLAEALPDLLSKRELKRGIEAGFCSVNGRIERFGSYCVGAGDLVVFAYEGASSASVFDRSHILYEDDDLLVYNKPSGIASDENGVLALLRPHFDTPLFLAHRLDKETSGALLLAKNPAALERVIALFKERKVEKEYLAIVDGTINEAEGTVDLPLIKGGSYQGQAFWKGSKAPGSLPAKTEWKSLKKGLCLTLVRCRAVTGRTHQIRVHMKSLGHPILGDTHYCQRFSSSLTASRLLLHASVLQLPGLRVEAPLFDDFTGIIERMKGE